MTHCVWCYGHGGDDERPCPNCGQVNCGELKRSASGTSEDAPISSSQSTGVITTDGVWKLLNEADDEKSKWQSVQWDQWFVRLVDAVCGIDSELARKADYDSGAEDCALCLKPTQNGVWACDLCWDHMKDLAREFLRLRERAAFDQAHGLRPLEQPVTTNAVDPSAQPSGTPSPRDDSSSSSSSTFRPPRPPETP